jgi:hypothetical protein
LDFAICHDVDLTTQRHFSNTFSLPEKFLNLADDFHKPFHFGLGVVKIKTGAGAFETGNWYCTLRRGC